MNEVPQKIESISQVALPLIRKQHEEAMQKHRVEQEKFLYQREAILSAFEDSIAVLKPLLEADGISARLTFLNPTTLSYNAFLEIGNREYSLTDHLFDRIYREIQVDEFGVIIVNEFVEKLFVDIYNELLEHNPTLASES